MAERSPGRGALAVAAGILLSRLVGLVRQRVVAHYLGTSGAADALTAALRVGNITQNLLGEGALSASFIPVYARLRVSDPVAAKRFARAALGALLPLVAMLSLAGVLAAPLLARVVAAGFDAERLATTSSLLRILFPMTGLLVIGAWALGVLNAHRSFFVPYAAPVVWSLSQIAAVLLAAFSWSTGRDELATAVAWGALGGAVLQLGVMAPGVRRALGSVLPVFDLRLAPLREAASKLPAAVMGRGVIQLSGLVDTLLVSLLGSGAVATFGYAQTIYLLPMSVLGTGEAAAALPALAEASAASTADETRRRALLETLAASLGRSFTLGIGAAVALGVLAPEIVDLLLRGGSFDAASSADVARVLSVYALGLPANAASRIYATTCFALGDTRSPARFATARVLVSTAAALALLSPLGVAGVVAGAVLAAHVELGLLLYRVRESLGSTAIWEPPWRRIIAAASLLAGAGLVARHAVDLAELTTILAALLTIGAAGVAFVLASLLLRLPGLSGLLRRRR